MGKWKFWLKQDLHLKEKAIAQQLSQGYCAPPRFLLWLWPFLDKLVSKWLGIEPLRKDKTGIISIELRQHRGQPIRLDYDTTIISGDRLIELHMNNVWFLHDRKKGTNSASEAWWRISSVFADDLRHLARQLAEERFVTEVKALHGITTLYPPAQRLGFTVKELPESFWKRLTTFYLSGLRQIYYFGKGKEYTPLRKPPALKEVWMSKSKLLEKYRP